MGDSSSAFQVKPERVWVVCPACEGKGEVPDIFLKRYRCLCCKGRGGRDRLLHDLSEEERGWIKRNITMEDG